MGGGVETCKEFPEQTRSTFLLTSPADHLSPGYPRVCPFIVTCEASSKEWRDLRPLIAENQIEDCNKIIQKLSSQMFSRVMNTLWGNIDTDLSPWRSFGESTRPGPRRTSVLFPDARKSRIPQGFSHSRRGSLLAEGANILLQRGTSLEEGKIIYWEFWKAF